MPSRLADRQIRAAAAFAAPTLDVRGPVSEALGRAGITVPPASVDAEPDPEAAPAPAPSRSIGKPTVPGLTPTVKPFEEAAWPTRRASGPEAVPLSGLTPDERRVHRILLDALVLDSERGYGNGTGVVGLSYLENKKLKALDLPFINAEIAKMDEGVDLSSPVIRYGMIGAAIAMVMVAGVLWLAGAGSAALGFLAASLLVPAMVPIMVAAQHAAPASSQRRKIYHALRELALLVDDTPVSEAVAQADALIDRLAEAETPASGADRAPRTRIRS